MLFNSLHFLLFFPAVVAVFFLIPQRFRWVLLLAASYYFYMAWEPEYALLILASTLIDYFAALKMHSTQNSSNRKLWLYGSLAGNLGILFFFKYANFVSESIESALHVVNMFYDNPTFALLLPVGISFYTFQSLSYTIDVYRGARPPEKHLGIFALYVSFFPQLVAGPIERSTHFLPQLYRQVQFSYSRATSGLRLMLWGYFLKLVVADNAGVLVDTVYAAPALFGGFELLSATFLFSMQIFGDFAGYSFIAIGTARILGYDLMENFRRPYLSRSIAEFWRRWHISLMTWFRDYLYIPLGGSRVKAVAWIRNIILVFLVSGIWHGANWTFVVWGALHAGFIVISKATEGTHAYLARITHLGRAPRIHAAIQIVTTFILVNIGWVFFRSESLADALLILKTIIQSFPEVIMQSVQVSYLTEAVLAMGVTGKLQLLALALGIGVLVVAEVALEFSNLTERFERIPRVFRWGVYYAGLAAILFFGYFGDVPFIYFQF